jgi:hypothetical protein
MTFGEGKSVSWIHLIIKVVLLMRPFVGRRNRASGKFPLILWAIYAYFPTTISFRHPSVLSLQKQTFREEPRSDSL